MRDITTKKKHVEETKESAHKRRYNELRDNSSLHMHRLLGLACEKGARAWLTALPIQALGYALNKEDL